MVDVDQSNISPALVFYLHGIVQSTKPLHVSLRDSDIETYIMPWISICKARRQNGVESTLKHIVPVLFRLGIRSAGPQVVLVCDEGLDLVGDDGGKGGLETGRVSMETRKFLGDSPSVQYNRSLSFVHESLPERISEMRAMFTTSRIN